MENSEQKRYSVVLTDDHHIVRHAIKTILDSSQRFNIVAEAEDAESTIELVEELKPDILVLDIGLPQKSGIEVLFELRRKHSPVKVVVLSMYEDDVKVKQALHAGANAYLLKNTSPKEFLHAIDQIMLGERYLPEQFAHLADSHEVEPSSANNNGTAQAKDPLADLSPRERQMFFLLAEGLPNRVIAKQLFISPRTVETHRARVIKKLGLKSNADLIRFAIRNSLIVL